MKSLFLQFYYTQEYYSKLKSVHLGFPDFSNKVRTQDMVDPDF